MIRHSSWRRGLCEEFIISSKPLIYEGKDMTVDEARKIQRDFYDKSNPSEEDIFLFTEAMGFLIRELSDPHDMMELGGWYYDRRRFDLALKYYEMASAYNIDAADECLGYIWYYGRTGEVDYKKAFEYYSKAAKRGDTVAEYKVADMYKNGYYVEKDYDKYCKSPNPIRDLHYNEVALAQSAQMGAGLPESLPAEVKGDNPYTHEFVFDISKNSLPLDKTKLEVIAVLIDTATGEVKNCNKGHVGSATGIEEVKNVQCSMFNVQSVYDLAGRRVMTPTKGIYIQQGKKVVK